MTTQEDIARALGISLMTVYRCLSGSGKVSAKTAARINEYIKEHNYRPNLMARALKTRRSNLIGLLMPSFSYSYYPEIIESIRSTLGDKYNLLLCLSGESAESELKELEMLLTIPVDGILMSPVRGEHSIEHCRYLEKHNVPYVLFDRYFSEDKLNCSYVTTDCVSESRKLVHYLYNKGHRRIAHLGGTPDESFSRSMLEGYKLGLADCGLEFDSNLVKSGELSTEVGCALFKEWHAQGVRFTALHAANDPLAIGALEACRSLNVKVPQELSVTGFSDIVIARNVYVPLTTVRESTAQIGRIAAETLIDAVENPTEHQKKQVLLPGTFVERKSCCNIEC